MTNLLNEQELRDSITALRKDRDAHLYDESDYVDFVVGLIQNQKHAYANFVIGKPIAHSEKCVTYRNTQQIDDKFCICFARQQNLLINDQHERNVR